MSSSQPLWCLKIRLVDLAKPYPGRTAKQEQEEVSHKWKPGTSLLLSGASGSYQQVDTVKRERVTEELIFGVQIAPTSSVFVTPPSKKICIYRAGLKGGSQVARIFQAS